MNDLTNRITQITDWLGSPTEMTTVVWISGLFNPQSFLTAIMQITAQSQSLELDKLIMQTEVTKKYNAEEFTSPAKDGAFIVGLLLEGGSWNTNQALLETARPREMFVSLPVVNIRSILADKLEGGCYHCPVYKTQQRGPTYVFSLQLKTKYDPDKWILAGVVSVMDVHLIIIIPPKEKG